MNFKLNKSKSNKNRGNSKPQFQQPVTSVFGDESDGEQDRDTDVAEENIEIEKQRHRKVEEEKSHRKETSAQIESQAKKIQQQAALEVAMQKEMDPLVYHYDEVYDQLQSKRERQREAAASLSSAAQHLEALLRSKKEKEMSREIARELKNQQNIKDEEAKYGQVETFHTKAYKKQQEELKEVKEEQQRVLKEDMKEPPKMRAGGLRGLYMQFLDDEDEDEDEDVAGSKQSEKITEKIEFSQDKSPSGTRNIYDDTDSENNDETNAAGLSLDAGLNITAEKQEGVSSQSVQTEEESNNGETVSFINNLSSSRSRPKDKLDKEQKIRIFLSSVMRKEEIETIRERYKERKRLV